MSALKRLAHVLGVTTDELVFDEDERGPDDELRLQLEAISRFDPDEKGPPRTSLTVSFSNSKLVGGLDLEGAERLVLKGRHEEARPLRRRAGPHRQT